MKRRTFIAYSALAMTLAGSRRVWADTTKLVLPTLHPESSPNTTFFKDWASQVVAASKGAVEIDVRVGTTIANFGNILERLQADVVQFGWIQPSVVAGRFPQASVVTLPGVRGNLDGGKASIAAWELYKSGLLDEEMAGLKLLEFGVHPEASLHFSKVQDRKSFADLRGLKIGVQGGVQVQVLQNLGATPISLAPPEWYEALERGTVDGIVTSWAAFPSLKLDEVTKQHVEGPLGNSNHLIAMNQAKWDALSPEVQAAIDSNSGAVLSESFGMHQNRQAAIGRDGAIAKGHEVRALTGEEHDAWAVAVEPIISEWATKNKNGEALLKTFRERVAAQ